MNYFQRFSTCYRFSDGCRATLLHRYAIRLEQNSWHVDIGFEQALETNIDRIIHAESIFEWSDNHGNKKTVSDEEKNDILRKLFEYCDAKALSYRVQN